MNVQLFIPCFIDQLYPQVAFNMVKVLDKVGCTVKYNVNQTCCGQPAFNAGFWSESKSVCDKFLDDFNGTDYIVSPSASCTGFVRNYYGKLYDNSAQINIARILISKNNLDIDVVGVVKDTRHRPSRILGDRFIISKYHDQILLANSDSHRFAIAYHRNKRDKKIG